MIKFIDNNGYTFDGTPPYIFWFEGAQSITLQYTKSILMISDIPQLTFSISKKQKVFRFANPTVLSGNPPFYLEGYIDKTDPEHPITYPPVATYKLTMDGETYGDYYIYQLIVIGCSEEPCQCQETINIKGENRTKHIVIGADFYELDEILQINLGNRGTEIPETIQKAIYSNDIKEDFIDNILVNRKFKELVSNYLDIMDNKGSYKSLYNSLKWFEWGNNAKIYEIWQNDLGFFEKELENILSEKFKNILFTHRKTSYISIVVALQQLAMNDPDYTGPIFDDEKNPVVENISHMWSTQEIMLKTSLLGAFFERYFLPIHLSLLHATAQSLVYTPAIKDLVGSNNRVFSWHDDWGVVDIKMDYTVVLGNINAVSAGKDTMFAYRSGYNGIPEFDNYDNVLNFGVDALSNVEYHGNLSGLTESDENELRTIWANVRGGVGVVVPITVTVPLPQEDALNTETLVLYRYPLDGKPEDATPEYVIERKLISPENIGTEDEPNWVAKFSFNLLSQKEEKVSFNLQLHSLSGHTWTAAATYEVIDTRGSVLHACRVSNKIFDSIFDNNAWATWNPYEGIFNTVVMDGVVPSDSNTTYKTYTQYLPTSNIEYLNEIVVVEVNAFDELDGNDFIISNYYMLRRGDSNKYIICIRKEGGEGCGSAGAFLTQSGITNTIVRYDHIFIPQLHEYTDIEEIKLKKDRATGRFIMSDKDYIIDPEKDLVCIIPQFKHGKLINDVVWTFTNRSTLEKITYDAPINQPLVLDNKESMLSSGYWNVELRYRFCDCIKTNTLSKNSVFLIKK